MIASSSGEHSGENKWQAGNSFVRFAGKWTCASLEGAGDRREVIRTEWRKEAGKWRQTSTTRTPEFALKYQVGEREVVSSGFDTGTSLHIGGQVLGKVAMDEWVAGKTIPCWYDPADPATVVVRRGFGGAYIFYLIPLPILWFGLRQLRKVGKAVRQLDERELAVG